jgi:3-hydroxybutyryl-CoA dehydrogenase
VKVADVKKVAIFGAGTMGPGLAQVFATAGYQVSMYTRRQETLDKAQSVTKQNLATFVENGLLKESEVPAILDRIAWTLSVEEGGKDADLVIETIAEKTDAKKELYEELDKICPRAHHLHQQHFVPEHL